MSELSDSDSDVTVQDDDRDVTAAAVDDNDDVDGRRLGDCGSAAGQGEGWLTVKEEDGEKRGPWFVRAPVNVSVGVGRTLRSECAVAGRQPIGRRQRSVAIDNRPSI